MKSIHQWLSEYGESHQDETNKLIHWICIPSIFFSITGMLFCIKLPFVIAGIHANVAMIVMVLAVLYYLALSRTLWIGMLIFALGCLAIAYWIESLDFMPLWLFCLVVFVVAWIGQFYGHHVEGKKPSFFKDVQFLMIGPAWLMGFIYKKMGIAI